MKTWIGFVYTFPEYRGNRYSEKLINYAMILAKKQGYDRVYISSNNKGMYEKFGFEFMKMMNNVDGHETQVFVKSLEKVNINDVVDFDSFKDSLTKR